MLKIAHITDTHISEEHKKTDDIDTRAKFLLTLDALCRQKPDVIIHTGDVCFPDGDRAIYSWVKEKLDETEIPYLLTAGNHDDMFMMKEIFNLKDQPPKVISTGAVAIKGESLMFLDSSAERLSMKQVIWLKREIDVQDDQLILFQHHPPCVCGVKVMDRKYPYKTPDLFQKTLKDKNRPLTVFSGHYHVEKKIILEAEKLTVYITPPTLGSLDPDAEDYIIADRRPGWREILIENQTLIDTKCRYLD